MPLCVFLHDSMSLDISAFWRSARCGWAALRAVWVQSMQIEGHSRHGRFGNRPRTAQEAEDRAQALAESEHCRNRRGGGSGAAQKPVGREAGVPDARALREERGRRRVQQRQEARTAKAELRLRRLVPRLERAAAAAAAALARVRSKSAAAAAAAAASAGVRSKSLQLRDKASAMAQQSSCGKRGLTPAGHPAKRRQAPGQGLRP